MAGSQRMSDAAAECRASGDLIGPAEAQVSIAAVTDDAWFRKFSAQASQAHKEGQRL